MRNIVENDREYFLLVFFLSILIVYFGLVDYQMIGGMVDVFIFVGMFVIVISLLFRRVKR